MTTVRLTVGQAIVRFLAVQESERDGERRRLFAGCFGIFGHGNVAGIGQALLEASLVDPPGLPFVLTRNEQAMVHAAAGYARATNRRATWACTTSIGPGATNLVTGAALATINRLPVLLLPGDTFATRRSGTVLQELEHPAGYDISVNDALRPVSRFFDRIMRPEQLASSLLAAMRVLTDPADTGAATIALPQDVQAEAWDWPADLLAPRTWRIARSVPETTAITEAAALIRGSRQPLIVAGGGVIYAEATAALDALATVTGIPVAETQAGKGSLPFDHPACVGAIGVTGTTAANELAREADVVIGIGTRWSDFTTASRTLFTHADVRFINCNVAAVDAFKHAALPVVGDARRSLEALSEALVGWSVDDAYRQRARRLAADWDATVERAYAIQHEPLPAQSAVIGVVNRVSGPRDVVVCAAGSMPGELHRLWRTRDAKGYHVEYGYSCMGYEIAGGLGVKLADPSREVFVLVGDGSFLMMAQEITTAVAEGVKLTIVLVQNHGFASIGALSESLGSQRFGTSYTDRAGARLPVDLAAVAEGLGAQVARTSTLEGFEAALRAAVASPHLTLVQVETDPGVPAPSANAWWDVPVAEVSSLPSTRAARSRYDEAKAQQRAYLTQAEETT